MVFASFSLNLIYQFWVHTERIDRLWRPIEFVFNTPSHHRVHHGMDAEYLDKNYGGILILWDRLFGSYADETFRPHYGLTKQVDTFNIWTLQTHESTPPSPATSAGPHGGGTGSVTRSARQAGHRPPRCSPTSRSR